MADGQRGSEKQMRGNPTLLGAARETTEKLWATANAGGFNDSENPEAWRVRQSIHAARGINGNGMGVPLTIQAQETMGKLWRTAGASEDSYRLQGETQASKMLAPQAINWMASLSGRLSQMTPMAGDLSWLDLLGSLPLCLNPSFVEWLMWGLEGIGLTCLGHPATAIEVTDFVPLATPSARPRRKRPSASSGTAPSESGRE